ncbi:unnamed protein product [Penicillium palitans]
MESQCPGLKSSFRFDDRLFVIRRQKIIDVSYFFTRKSRPATILQKAPQVHHDAHLLSLTGPQLTVLLEWTFDNHRVQEQHHFIQFKLCISVSPYRIAIIRLLISAAYTLARSLYIVGAIWAFRNGCHVNRNQFALTWAVLWLFVYLNFLVLDIFTIWLPPLYIIMALITWIVTNVTSILLQFELLPGFYKVGFGLPAHAVFQVLINIWSGGCNPLLYALPVLFVYEILGVIFSSIGVYRRAHYASINPKQRRRHAKSVLPQRYFSSKRLNLFDKKHSVIRMTGKYETWIPKTLANYKDGRLWPRKQIKKS